MGGRQETEAANPDAAVYVLDVEGIFHGDGEAVEGTKWLPCTGKVGVEEGGAVESRMEEGFGNAIGQLVGYGCALETLLAMQ